MIDPSQITAAPEKKPVRLTISQQRLELGIVATVIYLGIAMLPVSLAAVAAQIGLTVHESQVGLNVTAARGYEPVANIATNVWQYGDLTTMTYGDGSEMTYAAI